MEGGWEGREGREGRREGRRGWLGGCRSAPTVYKKIIN